MKAFATARCVKLVELSSTDQNEIRNATICLELNRTQSSHRFSESSWLLSPFYEIVLGAPVRARRFSNCRFG
jgi:hypothetical protein